MHGQSKSCSTQQCAKGSGLIIIAGPFLWEVLNSSKKAAIVAVCNGFQAFGAAVAYLFESHGLVATSVVSIN